MASSRCRLLAGFVAGLSVALLTAAQESHPATPVPAYQVRAAVGDIPTTVPVEPAGYWNVEETLRVAVTNATPAPVVFGVSPGTQPVEVVCNCTGGNTTLEAGRVEYHFAPATAPGDYLVAYRHRVAVPAASSLTYSLAGLPGGLRADAILVLYVPSGYELRSTAAPAFVLASTAENPGFRIYQFLGNATVPLPPDAVFELRPNSGRQPPALAGAESEGGRRVDWALLAGGVALGAAASPVALWAASRVRRRTAPAPNRSAGTPAPPDAYAGLRTVLEELDRQRAAGRIDAETHRSLCEEAGRRFVESLYPSSGSGPARPEAGAPSATSSAEAATNR